MNYTQLTVLAKSNNEKNSQQKDRDTFNDIWT